MDLSKDFYKFSLFTLISGIITVMILNGTAAEYIEFQSWKNELGMAFFSAMIFSGYFIGMISELKNHFVK